MWAQPTGKYSGKVRKHALFFDRGIKMIYGFQISVKNYSVYNIFIVTERSAALNG